MFANENDRKRYQVCTFVYKHHRIYLHHISVFSISRGSLGEYSDWLRAEQTENRGSILCRERDFSFEFRIQTRHTAHTDIFFFSSDNRYVTAVKQLECELKVWKHCRF